MDDAQVWELLERGGTLGGAHYEAGASTGCGGSSASIR